jgi:exonuclease VII small subunit
MTIEEKAMYRGSIVQINIYKAAMESLSKELHNSLRREFEQEELAKEHHNSYLEAMKLAGELQTKLKDAEAKIESLQKELGWDKPNSRRWAYEYDMTDRALPESLHVGDQVKITYKDATVYARVTKVYPDGHSDLEQGCPFLM